MVIKSLKLKNYRNYELLDMTFDSKTNILYGDNAQGKTNILEALYLSGTTKSHRGTKDRDLIQFGREESHLETIVEKKGMEFQIDMHLKRTVQKESQSIKFQFEKQVSCLELYILSFFLRRTSILSKMDLPAEEDLSTWSYPRSTKYI